LGDAVKKTYQAYTIKGSVDQFDNCHPGRSLKELIFSCRDFAKNEMLLLYIATK
jgi:hypothetical protein